MQFKRFLGLLSLLLILLAIAPACRQHKHQEGDHKGCCHTACCSEKCCMGKECGEEGCKMAAAEKDCSCKADCCKEKCCGGESCDDCMAGSKTTDAVSTDSAGITNGAGGAAGMGGTAADPFETAKYFCPMKCEGGYSDKPGKCKACGMDLKERK